MSKSETNLEKEIHVSNFSWGGNPLRLLPELEYIPQFFDGDLSAEQKQAIMDQCQPPIVPPSIHND